MKIMKSFVLLLAFAALTIPRAHAQAAGQTPPAAPKPAAKPEDLFADLVVAKGKGVEVKRSQLDDAMISVKASYAARGQVIPPEQATMLEQRLLDRLIQMQLLSSRANDADKAKAKELVEKRLADAKQRAGSEEAFTRQLKSIGMSLDEVRAKMVDEALAETVVKRELSPNATEADAKKYYDENTARFEQPEMVRASHVLLNTTDPVSRAALPEDQKAAKRKTAEEVLKKARAGEDFAKLAKEYSEDPGSKDKGGEYTFPRGQMVKEFEAAAFSLNTNQVSDIVTTQFGYHIIKLSEKLPAKKEPFAGLETKTVYKNNEGGFLTIRDLLTDQALQKQFPAYFEKLKKDANVEILDEKLKPKEAPAITPAPTPVQPEPKK